MDIVEENTADVYNGNHIKGHNYNDIYMKKCQTVCTWCLCLPSIIILFFIYDPVDLRGWLSCLDPLVVGIEPPVCLIFS